MIRATLFFKKGVCTLTPLKSKMLMAITDSRQTQDSAKRSSNICLYFSSLVFISGLKIKELRIIKLKPRKNNHE